MKKKNILILLLLFSMNFNIVHSYVINIFEAHSCNTSEYINDFSPLLHQSCDSDICHLHFAFHIPVILNNKIIVIEHKERSMAIYSSINSYKYNIYNFFLKPPITL